MTPLSDSDSMVRICACRSAGNWSMMRSTVLGRRGRVQGAEHEVTGLGGLDRDRDGLEVAQLADEDHVGVLAQGGPQSGLEATSCAADLALV